MPAPQDPPVRLAPHVQFVLFDGFDPLDVVAPYEVLSAGGATSGGAVTVGLVSAEGPRLVPSGTPGLSLRASAALDPSRPGWVLLPGASGRIGDPDETPGTGTESRPGEGADTRSGTRKGAGTGTQTQPQPQPQP